MQLKSIIEGALLAAGRPLTLDELADLFDLTDRPSTEELAAALLTDPIARLRQKFSALGHDLAMLDALENGAAAEVQAALDAADAAPWPRLLGETP